MKSTVNKLRMIPVAVIITLIVVSASFIILGIGGCGEEEAQEKMKVAASIVPLANFCRNVGGDLIEVEIMVPPGASPHTYEPTTGQMKFLSDASVFVYNGLDLETWITDVVEKTGNSELIKVVAAGNVPEPDLIAAAGGHDHESDQDENHEHGLYDPHVWLDPNLAVYQVEAIRDGFIKADPDNEGTYRKNADAYIAQLMDLDRQVKEETSTFIKKKFVSFHPAFTYFAHRYGLEQVGVIEELPGKEPSAGEIAELVDKINEEGVEVIFTEPQFNPQLAEMIAGESGVEVVLKSLDPLGDPDDPETDTYIKLTRRNVEVMAEAMK